MPDTAIQTRSTPRSAWKAGECPNPGGKNKVELEFGHFLEQPFDDQKKTVDQSWLELAYVLPRKALRLALTGTKKESGQIQQLVTAAAIAKDKRFPNTDDSLTIRIPARMLSSYSCAIILKPTSVENGKTIERDSPKP